LFAWFDGQGGINNQNYRTTPAIPGVTNTVSDSLDSPAVLEYTVGLSRRLGARGVLRADAIYRDYRDFYALVTNPGTGKVTDSLGHTFDLTLVENANADERRYVGLTLQGNYRVSDRLDIAGNYTLSWLRSTLSQDEPAQTTGVLSFPEYHEARWFSPVGDHPADQRHRLRAWSTFRLPGPARIGDFTVAAIERIESGTPYAAIGSVNTTAFVTNPGYENPPAARTYVFTARDAFRTDWLATTDLALNYNYRMAGAGRPELFAQVQLLNAFNESEIIAPTDGFVDLSVLERTKDQSYEAFNPFTTTPVRGVHWDYGPDFGTALGAGAYNRPRTFLVSFGVRY
jgi:hypothetical protein